MDEILAETYGIMVYQEQVMQIFNQLGGIELSNAYKLIKAISKKTADVIAKFKPDFIKGTMAKGVSKDKAEEIFDLILKFGGYGFNKSHSTRYAIVAFQTAYMKTYHPIEYMAAVLTFEMGSTEKVVEYIEECRKMGREGAPAGRERLGQRFHARLQQWRARWQRGEGRVRFASACAPSEASVKKPSKASSPSARRRASSEASTISASAWTLRTVQRSTIEALIKCGAFSSISPKRAQLLQVFERAVEWASRIRTTNAPARSLMFAAPVETSSAPSHVRHPSRHRRTPQPSCSNSKRNCSAFTSPATR